MYDIEYLIDRGWFIPYTLKCDCGCDRQECTKELMSSLTELASCMEERITIVTGFICPEYCDRFPGYADSGHKLGTDVDILVVGQYYRHKILKYVTTIFPVVTLTPRIFHLSVRSDWPQNICHIS